MQEKEELHLKQSLGLFRNMFDINTHLDDVLMRPV